MASTCAALVRTVSPVLSGMVWKYGMAAQFSYGVFLFGASGAVAALLLFPFIH